MFLIAASGSAAPKNSTKSSQDLFISGQSCLTDSRYMQISFPSSSTQFCLPFSPQLQRQNCPKDNKDGNATPVGGFVCKDSLDWCADKTPIIPSVIQRQFVYYSVVLAFSFGMFTVLCVCLCCLHAIFLHASMTCRNMHEIFLMTTITASV